jgi:MFS transporter, DHA2 family, multidrug resistance protein
MVALGMVIFFAFTFWGYKIMTPDTAEKDFFWMLILRGVGMGFLFIPITMLSLSTLKGQQIGQGAAFTGMMRQLGGSFGIALITTYMASQLQVHRNSLVSHMEVNNPYVQNRVVGLQHSFMSKGFTPANSLQKAYTILDYSVSKQAAVLSYMDVFLFLGIMFLICVPIVLVVKGKKESKVSMADAMH